MRNKVDKRSRNPSKNFHDPRQPQLFVHERRQASIEKFAASRRAKAAADAEAAAAKAAAVAAEETAKKAKAAQVQANMTDELLEHFDISGFNCPKHWDKTLGVSFEVENACKNDYEKRLFFIALFKPKNILVLTFGLQVWCTHELL